MTKCLQSGCAALCIFLSTALFAQQHPVETEISTFAKVNFAELAQKELQHPSTVPPQRYIEFRRELPDGKTSNRPTTGDAQLTEITIPNETGLFSTQPPISPPGPLKSFT